MYASKWTLATLDYDRSTTEFVGDDADRFSALIDLGDNYEDVTIDIPTLSASAVVSIYAQRDGEIATVPKIIHILDDDATGSFAHSTSSGAGDIIVTFRLGGYRYMRVHCGANQSANRLFYCRGFNRTTEGT